MLLIVNNDIGDDIITVWDTDDMVVERMGKRLFWEHVRNGNIEVKNVIRHPDPSSSREFAVSNFNIFPLSSPVVLGCGDVWYSDYVWHALTGCLYKVGGSIYHILVGNGVYTFCYIMSSDTSFVYKDTFENIELGVVPIAMQGMSGQVISKEEFMKKVVLGVL